MDIAPEPDLAQRLQAACERIDVVEQQNTRLEQQNARLEQENALLRQKVDLLVRRIFGQSSEKLDSAQLELLLGMAAAESGKAAASPALLAEALPPSSPAPSPRRRRREPRWPDDLPVVETVLDPPQVQAHPETWRCIGVEVSDQLDLVPGYFQVQRLIRRRYVSRTRADEPPVIAPLPAKLQERGLPTPALLAHVLTGKYADHLPLYRQEQIYRTRYGVDLPRQTLANWVGMAADWLRPIYQEICMEVRRAGYMQIDETPVEYLVPGHGQTKHGYLWTCSQPGGEAFFHWETSRAARCLENIIPVDFSGTVQSDGYAAYGAFARRHGGEITLAGCWAHARRGFREALDSAPQHAAFLLKQIQLLYAIERRLREERAGPQLREAVRASESRMIHARIHRVLGMLKLKKRHWPQSAMGKAIDYALGQWRQLSVYLRDGRIEIDNNLVENTIRPTAVGKKNWLFIGAAEAGPRGAILYTIIESCRRHGLDVARYLTEVLTALPTMTNWQVKDWTPAAWAKARCAARQAA